MEKCRDLIKNIGEIKGPVLLAYSGGVDSTFLMSILKECETQFLPVTVSSSSVPDHELKKAVDLAEKFNLDCRVIESTEFDDKDYINNTPDRCFYCKRVRFGILREMANKEGFSHIFDGTNADDAKYDYRPGLRANKLFAIESPLMEMGFTKNEIRVASRLRGLSTWDQPSGSCLSTRIPYGQQITRESVDMVEKAELFLRQIGFIDLRVRKNVDTAWIEIDSSRLLEFVQREVREKVINKLKELGFLYVTLDLEGLESGKLNRSVETAK